MEQVNIRPGKGDLHETIQRITCTVEAVELAHHTRKNFLSNEDSSEITRVFVENGPISIMGPIRLWESPVIFQGILSARILIEFMGLCGCNKTNPTLEEKKTRKNTDIGIEDFSKSGTYLKKVSNSQLELAIKTPTWKQAENALASIYVLANKHLAHLTTHDIKTEIDKLADFDSALCGIPILMDRFFFTQLGITRPPLAVEFVEFPVK